MDKYTENKLILLNNPKVNGKLLDYEEFYLIYTNIIFKKIIGKKEEGIIIKTKNYVISFNKNDLSSLIWYNFTTIDEMYRFIINSFNKNKVFINDIESNKNLKLFIKMNIMNTEENVELVLKYDIKNKDFDYIELNKNYNKLINEINELKNEINKLKNEVDSLKSYCKKHKSPIEIESLSELTKNSYSDDVSDNTFTVFETIQNDLYLIFSNKMKSIICYDLKEQNILIEVKNCHNEYITNFRHILDYKNQRDLIISISYTDKNVKLWDTIKWECILNLSNIYSNGYLYSACLLNDNDNIYILTSNSNLYGDSEAIKVFDIHGNLVKEIVDSNESTSFIDTYFDKKLKKIFLLTGNSNYVKSYDYFKNEEFLKYSDNYNNNHLSIIISELEDITKLVESCYDGNIRIWNFHTGALLNKIRIGYNWLYGICLWDKDYLFAGSSDKAIKLINITNGYIAKNLTGHSDPVLTIKKINHPKYGQCLLSQGYNEDQIKLWINKD